jgi:hypothetical protein
MYTVNVDSNQDSRLLYFTCDNENIIKDFYNNLSNDLTLPKIETMSVSNEKYTGLFSSTTSGEEILYTPYGRFFSNEEMSSATNVALLGTDYIKSLSEHDIDTIWESKIDIKGVKFNAIGNYFFDYPKGSITEDLYKFLLVPTTITIPLKTYFDIELIPNRFRCVFSQSLTNEQIKHLGTLLQSYNLQELSLPSSYEINAVNSYISGISAYIIVLILSLINAVNVMLYWLRKEFIRYKIYLICGAKGGQIAFFISLNVVLLVTVTYMCAYFAVSEITKISPHKFTAILPWQYYTLIYFGVILLTLIIVHIKSIPIVFQKKMIQK